MLTHENSQNGTLTAAQIDDLARYTMISVQGLWFYARLTDDVAVLRAYSDNLVTSLEARLRGASH